MKSKKKGFTVIEMVLVITIVGILSSIGLAKYREISNSAKGSKIKAIGARIAQASFVNYMGKHGGQTYTQVTATNICQSYLMARFLSPAVFPDADYNMRSIN